jgi:uncharacterized protein
LTIRTHQAQPLQHLERLHLGANSQRRFAILSDTHSSPHPRTLEVLRQLRPDAILHAGDIGELRVLDELATVCQVFAVRGNIDTRRPTLPDVLVLEIGTDEELSLRVLMLHVGINGTKLRADAARLARAVGATMVVCGHSHVPFIGIDRGITVFNPGSAGPRRFSLPIVFGLVELSAAGIRMGHIDCATGQTWEPPA